MRKIYLFTITILLITSYANAQEFEWAKRLDINEDVHIDSIGHRRWGQKGYATVDVVGADAEGNVYTVGFVRDSTSLRLDGYTEPLYFPKNGFYVAKHQANGNLIWIRDIGGGIPVHYSHNQAWSIAVDQKGDFWLTGNASDSVTVFKGIKNEIRLEHIGNYEVGFLVKYSRDGELLWGTSMKNGWTRGTDLKTDTNGNLYVTGYFGQGGVQLDEQTKSNLPLDYFCNFFLAKYSPQGKLLWAKYGNAGNASSSLTAFHLALDASGNPYVSGEFYGNAYGNEARFISGQNEEVKLQSNTIGNIFLAKYTTQGEFVWAKKIGSGSKGYDYEKQEALYILNSGLTADFSGKVLYLSGYHTDKVTFEEGNSNEVILAPKQTFIAQLNLDGNIIWAKGFETYIDGRGCKIVTDRANSLFATGTYLQSAIFEKGQSNEIQLNSPNSILDQTYIAKWDANGRIGWAISPKADTSLYTNGLSASGAGNVYAIGQYLGKAYFGNTVLNVPKSIDSYWQNFVFALHDNGVQFEANTIHGNVYQDANANGKKELEEASMDAIVIKAEPGPYYTLTDSLGNYSIRVEKSNYTISQQLPSTEKSFRIQQTYPKPPGTYQVSFNGYGKDTTGFDFGNNVTKLPYLKVDIAADRLRRCFRSTTTIHYRNEGYAAANNVQVQITYPKYVLPISASTAWNSKRDSLLTFSIGTLQPNQGGTITIVDSVVCGNESIRGLTQCVKAVIIPKNDSPTPDARWDKSEVELKAVCKNNGFVRLTILNPGMGAMADSSSYRIFLDAVKVFESQYQLASKDSLTLEVPVNGKTIRLEADLRPYHPDGNRQPSITLEGCGNAGTVNISKGFVNQLPQDDAPEEVAVSCLEIRDSYDPNDKQVSPAGVGEQHTIAKGETLEYLIRFQNTSNDLAYNVVIQDTLDEHLDIATLQIGAVSHPFTWSVSGKGRPIITWTFKNINLPDSSSNEPKSHGYVRFRIGQKADNAVGITITNQAAITFDFNSSVLTNLIVNTTGEIPQALSSVPVDVCKGNYPSQAQAGYNIVLQAIGTTTLHANVAQKGRGQWQFISGKGTIAEPGNPQSLVAGLGVGSTILEWTITLCDSVSRSQLTIERVIPPPMVTNSTVVVCAGEVISLTATGTSLVWYADEQLSYQLAQGTSFQPTTGGDFYVTQTIDGYESQPARVTATVQSRPAPPPATIPTRLYCQGESIEALQATGEGIRWYADSQLTQLLTTGATFQPGLTASATFYATQTVANCEGAASAVPVTILPARISVQTKGDTLIAPLADAYQWYFEGKPLEQATGQQHIAHNTGNYHVVLEKGNCTASSDPSYRSIHVQAGTLSLTPNPSPDRVRVELTDNSTGRVEMRLLNTLGKVVQQHTWQKPTTILNQELDVSHLTGGVYFVEVNTGEGVLVKKFVKN